MAETQIAAFRSRWAQAHCALRRIRVGRDCEGGWWWWGAVNDVTGYHELVVYTGCWNQKLHLVEELQGLWQYWGWSLPRWLTTRSIVQHWESFESGYINFSDGASQAKSWWMDIIRTNDVKLTAQAVWDPSDPIRAAAGCKRLAGFLERFQVQGNGTASPTRMWKETEMQIFNLQVWLLESAWTIHGPGLALGRALWPEAIPIDYIPWNSNQHPA